MMQNTQTTFNTGSIFSKNNSKSSVIQNNTQNPVIMRRENFSSTPSDNKTISNMFHPNTLHTGSSDNNIPLGGVNNQSNNNNTINRNTSSTIFSPNKQQSNNNNNSIHTQKNPVSFKSPTISNIGSKTIHSPSPSSPIYNTSIDTFDKTPNTTPGTTTQLDDDDKTTKSLSFSNTQHDDDDTLDLKISEFQDFVFDQNNTGWSNSLSELLLKFTDIGFSGIGLSKEGKMIICADNDSIVSQLLPSLLPIYFQSSLDATHVEMAKSSLIPSSFLKSQFLALESILQRKNITYKYTERAGSLVYNTHSRLVIGNTDPKFILWFWNMLGCFELALFDHPLYSRIVYNSN